MREHGKLHTEEDELVSIGLAYERSPVKDEFRPLDFPVDERWKVSAAYGWKHSDDMSFSLGATLSFGGGRGLGANGAARDRPRRLRHQIPGGGRRHLTVRLLTIGNVFHLCPPRRRPKNG